MSGPGTRSVQIKGSFAGDHIRKVSVQFVELIQADYGGHGSLWKMVHGCRARD